MNFIQNEIYISREGKEYVYVERRGGVLIFDPILSEENRLLTNLNGQFRWDNQDHPFDIIKVK